MEKRLRFLKIGQETAHGWIMGCVCFRKLDEEVFKPKGLCVGEDRVELIPGDPAIQVRVVVVKNRVIL